MNAGTDPSVPQNMAEQIKVSEHPLWLFIMDENVSGKDINLVAWQVLSNSDPNRDISIHGNSIIFDARAKVGRSFKRKWPNVVVSSAETINPGLIHSGRSSILVHR
ncbi:MAG: hypothetical protein R2744_06010 [Bacteroidales bacterium]